MVLRVYKRMNGNEIKVDQEFRQIIELNRMSKS